MGKKNKASGLGRSIIKDRFGGKKGVKGTDSYLHTSELNDGYDWGRLNLQSVTEQSNLDEFLATAELAGTEFTAEKLNVTIVNAEKHTGLLTIDEEKELKVVQDKHKALLRIPRRPHWDESTTKEELDENERTSFLEWRRGLAELQEKEKLLMTPFERNLDFWRQLWRVVERSDLVVQIVDARNPLLFRCEDLEKYVKEVNPEKENVVLINKADLLTEKQRAYWAKYFESIDIQVVFWSAVLETERINNEKKMEEEQSQKESDDSEDEMEKESEDSEDEETEPINENVEIDENETNTIDENIEGDSSDLQTRTENMSISNTHNERLTTEESRSPGESASDSNINETGAAALENTRSNSAQASNCDDKTVRNNFQILNGDELIEFFRNLHSGTKYTEEVTTVGLVGYPNVGKSSTINAILQSKKVPVSATPGRTKHFQTLFVDKALMLCDCPGLVMPSFVSTKAEMVLNGILPIDQMRDYIPPVSLLCKNIQRPVLENIYGIMLPTPREGEDPNRPPSAHELLGAYACMRGFMTHKGLPDFSRASRNVLKDYVNGKLLYCKPCPNVDEKDFQPEQHIAIKATKTIAGIDGTKNPKAQKAKYAYSSEVDKQFFEEKRTRMGSKGVNGQAGAASSGNLNSNALTPEALAQRMKEKPWKKHGNKNKKEKLRRQYHHLDA